jgi:drug/metabolite transporter (DMT)-like permease
MVLGRWLRDDIGPVTLSASRFLIGGLIFWLLLQRHPPAERRLGADRWSLLVMALCGVVFFAPTLYLGLRYTTAANATLMNGLSPLTTGLLATLLIGESMSSRQVGGAVIGLVGVFILISGGSLIFWQTLESSIGDLIILVSMLLWGLYSVFGRQVMRRRSVISVTAWSILLALPFLIVGALWELTTFPVNLRPEVVVALLYIGTAPTVVGILAWNTGVHRLGPTGAMVFYNTLPLYGVLLGYLWLGESIGWPHLVGGALIIGGGIWGSRG